MLEWMRLGRSAARRRPDADAEPAKRHGRIMSGEYRLLYKYLEDRYAHTVVLTFAEIEDILGFTLPDAARLHQEWWTSPDPTAGRVRYSNSWILASRTAKPNLVAETVVFERAS